MLKEMVVTGFQKSKALDELDNDSDYESNDESDNDSVQSYSHYGATRWPNVFYYPDYTAGGNDIKSFVNINFPYNDHDAIDEADRLSKEILKVFGRDFKAYLYDSNLDEYFEREDL